MKKFIVDYKINCNNCDSHDTQIIFASNIQEAETIAENNAVSMTDEDYYYNVSSVEDFKEADFMTKFYNIELINPEEITNFRTFLKLYKIYFETSAAGDSTHFEVKLNKNQLEAVDDYLNAGIQNTIEVFDYCINEKTAIGLNYIDYSCNNPETENRLYFVNLDGIIYDIDKI